MLGKVIRAKYKKGVFEPLEPVDLPEDEVVDIPMPEKTSEKDDAAFLSSIGSWKDLVSEDFVDEIYELRKRSTRPAVEL
ncbi:MAG TPA: antitoxin family protein [bacterium]|nr:antitoxin family protein [bacterium]